jgi:dienelactone hydrolase
MDKITEPTSWFTTIVYKPVWVFQALSKAIPWKMKSGIPATYPGVVSFFQALRTSPPPFPTDNLKVAAAGFCWGGKHAFLLAQDKPETRVIRHQSQKQSTDNVALIDCVFAAHPSYLEVPVDIDAVTIPVSVAVGDVDMAMKEPLVKKMKEILEAKKDGRHEVNIFPGAKHGFSVRVRPEDKVEMELAEKAEVQAIDWFNRWLA